MGYSCELLEVALLLLLVVTLLLAPTIAKMGINETIDFIIASLLAFRCLCSSYKEAECSTKLFRCI